MGIFHSSSWTGAKDDGGTVLLEPRPAIKSTKLTPATVSPLRESYLAEYAELAKDVGIMPHDLGVEAFKAFLHATDIPTFSLAEVISYMDTKAAKESKDQAGWEWRPLRECDHRKNIGFGRPAERGLNQYGHQSRDVVLPASDYYRGPTEINQPEHVNMGTQWVATGKMTKHLMGAAQSPYDKTIPLHALRKVAAINKEFGDTVGLFVCDYALAPAIEHPDPFLMAVIANPKVGVGTGRFVIDFWDEPGFGIDKMVK